MTDSAQAGTTYVRGLNSSEQHCVAATARGIQDEILGQIDAEIVSRLQALDERFRTDSESPSRLTSDRTVRRATPWFDFLGLLATTSAFVAAAGAGRIPTAFPWRGIETVSVVVEVCFLIALIALVLGWISAHKERRHLAIQRTESRAVTRAMFIVTSLMMTVGAVVSLGVRFDASEVVSQGLFAVLAAGMYMLAASVAGWFAYRFARGTPAAGKFITKTRTATERNMTDARLCASETAQVEAHELLLSLDSESRSQFFASYTAAVRELRKRRLLSDRDLLAFRVMDWAALRFRPDT